MVKIFAGVMVVVTVICIIVIFTTISFGIGTGLGSMPTTFKVPFSGILLAVLVMYVVWKIYKKEYFHIAVVALITIAFLSWLGPFRTQQIATAVNTGGEKVASGMTNLVTTGTTKSTALLAAEAKAAVEAEKQSVINAAVAQAAAEAEAAKYRPLTTDAFTTNTIGKFIPLQIKSSGRIGPINDYDVSCLSWAKSGMGMFYILSRPDFTSEPVPVMMTDHGYGIKKWGHPGPAYQLFFEAKEGDVQIELERRDGDGSC